LIIQLYKVISGCKKKKHKSEIHNKGVLTLVMLATVEAIRTCFLIAYSDFSEKERQQCVVSEACGCLWAYLADLRASEGSSHVHYNPFYDPLKHDGPLLPPAAALAPTLWPRFHLRWACPSEAQAGEVEGQCRKMAIKFSELQKVLILLLSSVQYISLITPSPLPKKICFGKES